MLTDSGGLREETTALGVPRITMHENTARPVTADDGTNILAGTSLDAILTAARTALSSGGQLLRRLLARTIDCETRQRSSLSELVSDTCCRAGLRTGPISRGAVG